MSLNPKRSILKGHPHKVNVHYKLYKLSFLFLKKEIKKSAIYDHQTDENDETLSRINKQSSYLLL